jgi:ABC-type nitrate/sulfonate/bicarbonate transport system ATPase subunit
LPALASIHPHVRPGRSLADGKPARGTLKTRRPRVYETFRLVVLEPNEKASPHELSGSIAQSVTLARALVIDPEVRILDEPLGKFDSLTRLTMQAASGQRFFARAAISCGPPELF